MPQPLLLLLLMCLLQGNRVTNLLNGLSALAAHNIEVSGLHQLCNSSATVAFMSHTPQGEQYIRLPCTQLSLVANSWQVGTQQRHQPML